MVRKLAGFPVSHEGEQLAEGLVWPLGEGHAARRRLAGQQAVLPRGLARLTTLWGEFLYQGIYDASQEAPSDRKMGTRF